MLIDWFTTIAQIVNFLILVVLLKYFLYGPIIRAMDERQQKIAHRLQDAEAANKEAADRKQRFEEKTAELERRKESILAEAKEAADKDRRRMEQDMRQRMDEAERQWQRNLQKQQQSFIEELERRAATGVLDIAARAIRDLADRDLQDRMAQVFAGKLEMLDKKSIRRLRDSLDENNPAITITSVFEAESTSKQKLTETVHSVFGEDIAVRYERNEELLAGLKLNSDNEVVGWNLEEYLAGLKREVEMILQQGNGNKEAEAQSQMH